MMDQVLTFWFEESGPAQWFAKDLAYDQKIIEQFGELYEEIAQEKHDSWRLSAHGCLAEIIVLDQFSRNMFRDSPRAFEADAQARGCLNYAISMAYDRELTQTQRNFLYLPFEHSEDKADQDKSIHYFTENGDANTLDYALKHKVIIDRFARYPHRNEALGRVSTKEELAFLQEPGSSF